MILVFCREVLILVLLFLKKKKKNLVLLYINDYYFLKHDKKKWVILETNKLQILLMNVLRAQKILHIKLLPRFKVLRAANPLKHGKMLLFSLLSERSNISNFLSMGKP